ncbi:MAG: hypothetical protein NC434_15285, partial [Ruminococcus sp.]|nr:hypothetical protein [Ruminococcus sp.]
EKAENSLKEVSYTYTELFEQEYPNIQEDVEMSEEFNSFEGKWIIGEYIDSAVESHGVDINSEEYKNSLEEMILELKEKYENYIFEVYEDSIEYFYPASELGYYYSDYSILFDIYRQPPTIEIVPPFLCASLRIRGLDEEMSIIIDGNGEAVLEVEHCFFKIDKIN